MIKLETNKGDILIDLNYEKAPITTSNFETYVKEGFYDGTIFHRVINDFMVQGGGFDENMKQKNTKSPIKNEANNGLKNKKYTIAMARTQDPHSATSQFFINVSDNDFLDFSSTDTQGWGYAVFGEVINGQEVIDTIKSVKTSKKLNHDDVPVENVVILKATVV